MSSPKLSPTSYLVLGLVAQFGPLTPYDLKQQVQGSIGYFWNFPHSQLYAEPTRLAREGLLDEEQEAGGRRRRLFSITARGREAIGEWLAAPVDQPTEIRDLGLMQLFFGGLAGPEQVQALAQIQREAHKRRLTEYEELWNFVKGEPEVHAVATLQLGLRFEKMAITFWDDVAKDLPRS
jgi:PadR family transcriptional regulator AphA